jgi:hypothetical protein
MDPHSGKIKLFENIEAAKAAGYTVELSDEQAKEMLKLSERSRVNLIQYKQKQKLIKKVIKSNKQKLKANKKNERNRRNKH